MWSDDLYIDFTNPYDKRFNFYMCIEHVGRYMFARDFIAKHNINKVLDVGCGSGFGCEIMSETADFVEGIEYRKRLLTPAIKNSQIRAIQNISYYYSRFKHEDAFFPSDDYDLIVCFDTLACIKEQQKFLKTLYNHTSKEGYLLLAVPNFSCEPLNQDGTIAIPTHINKYTIEIIRKILKNAKYQILDIYGQPFSNIMMNREYTLITKYNLSEKKVKSYYGYKKEYIDYFARLMAYPTTKQVEVSYYFIVLAKKI